MHYWAFCKTPSAFRNIYNQSVWKSNMWHSAVTLPRQMSVVFRAVRGLFITWQPFAVVSCTCGLLSLMWGAVDKSMCITINCKNGLQYVLCTCFPSAFYSWLAQTSPLFSRAAWVSSLLHGARLCGCSSAVLAVTPVCCWDTRPCCLVALCLYLGPSSCAFCR